MGTRGELERENRHRAFIISRLSLLALAVLLVWPVALHPTWWIWKPRSPASDLAVTHWPNAHFTRRVVWGDGHFPLWRPTIMSGTPFAANPLAGLYYPPNWPLLFLPWFPLALGFNLSAVTHLALAGATMYALMRRGFGTDLWAGLVAAVTYQASPKLLAHLGAGHVGWVQAWAWLPLAALCALKGCQSRRGIDDNPWQASTWALGAGVVLAVQFCADVRLSAYTLMAAASLVLAWAVSQLSGRRTSIARANEEIGTPLGAIKSVVQTAVLSVALFAGLSACQWLPGFTLLPDTTRSSMTFSDAAVWSLPWRYLSGLLLADHGGFQEWMTYVGTSTLVLAWVGAQALWHDRRRRWLGAWLTGLGAFAAWLSLGKNGGLFQVLWRIVPGLGLLRVPPRAWVLVTFTTAVLAGVGLEEARQQRDKGSYRSGHWKQALLLGAAAFPLMLLVSYWLTMGRPPLNLTMFGLITPLTIAVCAAPSVISVFARSNDPARPPQEKARGRPPKEQSGNVGWLGVAAVLLVALDLLVVDFSLIETRSPKEVFAQGHAAAEWLADQPGRFRIYSPSYSLPQHVAEQHALELADGVDPLQLRPYADYLTGAAGLQDRQGYSVTLPPFPEGGDVRTALANASPNTEMLGQLGVRYVAAAFPITHRRLDLVRRFDDVYVYKNEDARPVTGEASDPRIILADGRVLFRYRPWAVYGGVGISGLTLLGVVGWRLRAVLRQLTVPCQASEAKP